ncbi:hypothetical protein TMatcc_009856 [Talaromyces marneffei ATCC 18224]|uniref:Uncharacterized protein n=2 Tax=Talaromyces marneffei TaxID=37727 RepID=B6QTL6_TALMQ|nr:uncharacterized protein EYB26_009081 [Talaromyces marneffei]EEA19708.1 hypothetical protein PMAA_004870 [Talaromyces marneffei ATCC 18224]KAE8548020.1 hypothetical protein EYB25_009813 [Talaromyces marneffei]QGA21371.1 hypothetical protein EYB26_009081 [Talaromyces marneffei]
MTTSTDPSPEGAAVTENEGQQQQQSNTLPSNENREEQPNNDAAERDVDTQTLPDYSRHAGGPPSYARVERNDQLRQESLKAFVESKMYTQDTFGGHKGIATGPPNDPAKPFRWIQRKLKGEKGVWKKLSEEERRKWEEEGGDVDYDAGEVAIGDMNTSKIA